jgi:peptidoglycan/xylan/chitin deacetylase (PgdA/CDA1 family)
MLGRRQATIAPKYPIVSFTFDDFPRSALYTGGAILKRYGATGTYFASFGLMGKQAPTGTMFLEEDLTKLFEDGHELGCHTFAHCHPWETKPALFEESVVQNQRALSELRSGTVFRTMSYPLTVPSPETKRRTGRHFTCCRGRGQTFNLGTVDLNCLSSHFLERKLGGPEEALKIIEENRAARGWLIFSTHDISDDPTPWGWTPGYFEDVVRRAVNSGARIMTVAGAWDALLGESAVESGTRTG